MQKHWLGFSSEPPCVAVHSEGLYDAGRRAGDHVCLFATILYLPPYTLGDTLLMCCLWLAGRFLANKFLRKHTLHSHAIEQHVEWCGALQP